MEKERNVLFIILVLILTFIFIILSLIKVNNYGWVLILVLLLILLIVVIYYIIREVFNLKNIKPDMEEGDGIYKSDSVDSEKISSGVSAPEGDRASSKTDAFGSNKASSVSKETEGQKKDDVLDKKNEDMEEIKHKYFEDKVKKIKDKLD